MAGMKTVKEIMADVRAVMLDEEAVKTAFKYCADDLEDKDQLAEQKAKTYKMAFEKLLEERAEENPSFKMPKNCGVLKTFEEIAKKDFWLDYYDNVKEWYLEQIKKSETENKKITGNRTYIKYVDFITDKKPLKRKKQSARAIAKTMPVPVRVYDSVARRLIIKGISKNLDKQEILKVANAYNKAISTWDSFEPTSEEKRADFFDNATIPEIREDLKPYVAVFLEIEKNTGYLLGQQTDIFQNEQVEEQQNDNTLEKEKAEIIPRLYPGDEMLISHSTLINTLVENGFKISTDVFNQSEKTIKSLTRYDQDLLDFLILNLYASGVRRFTDRQIVTLFYKSGNPNARVNNSDLKRVNESIERLRRTEIKQGFESLDKIEDSKLKFTERPMLISVLPRDIEHRGNTTVYDFTGVQGYYEYAQLTHRQSRYDNALITSDIIGIQHDFKNDQLRRTLTRRVTGLEYSKQTGVDVREIYEILEITDPRKYTGAREKVLKILGEIEKKYNFKYRFKKKGRTTTLLILERCTDKPLKKIK